MTHIMIVPRAQATAGPSSTKSGRRPELCNRGPLVPLPHRGGGLRFVSTCSGDDCPPSN